MCNLRTIDGRLIYAASGTHTLGTGDLVVPHNLYKICDRVLRGRAPDRRVTDCAVKMLSNIIWEILQANGFKSEDMDTDGDGGNITVPAQVAL